MASTGTRSSSGQRFTRAANLELDFDQPSSVDGYLLTGTGRRALRRLAPAMQASSTSRAWSLTGPYGTGKSAFALYLSALLTPEKSAASKNAHRLLREADPELAQNLSGRGGASASHLASIPVTGTSEPLPAALLRGLERSLKHHVAGSGGKAATSVRKAQDALRGGKSVGSPQILELLDATVSHVCASPGTDGAFLIIDELGRLLDYANNRPEESDLGILQDLAEYANRSNRPFLMMTIRHQSLTAYSANLPTARRIEWEKIQGRFEDIEFIEPADEMLRLLARAMEVSIPESSCADSKPFAQLVRQAWQLGIAPDQLSQNEFADLLARCHPLHPIVSTILGFVFRRLGQNERSAFSFLFSHEPFGLQEFLRKPDPDGLFGVARLYDYLSHNIREALYTSSYAKRWAEIETVLDQLVSGTAVEERIVKSIGLINALGATDRLRATREVISCSMGDTVTLNACNREIDRLIDRSVVVDRHYNKTLALWEGSDVDLDAELLVARDRLDASTPVADLASRFFGTRPIVAKRHSFQTGALRYFPVSFCTADSLAQLHQCTEPLGISIVLASRASELDGAVRRLRKLDEPTQQGRVFCIALEATGFTTAIRDLAALEWVRDNVKPLEGDRTARKELTIRIEEVRRLLGEQLDRILNPERLVDNPCRWFRGGKELHFKSGLRLQDILSQTCDDIYSSSPRILNELLNRRELSSAAAGARRNLIERMFQDSNKADLGILGTPPEKSLYLSLLQQGGLHRKMKDSWEFLAPQNNAPSNLKPAWDEITRFFGDTDAGSRMVAELFSRLSAPPFGVLEGPLPVLFCAALLVHEHEIALYKDGTFIPSPDTPDFELLMKNPDRYSVQRWRISGVRTAVFQRLAELLGREIPGIRVGRTEILELIKPLLRFFKGLNDYSLYTHSISDEAAAIREVLQKANEPDTMLFSDLPTACGVKPFASKERASSRRVEEYIERLRNGLRELQTAYERLLQSVFELLQTAFGIEGDLDTVRTSLTQRGSILIEACGNPTLKSFITRMLQPEFDKWEWVEALAGVVVIKPSAKWRDADLDRFRQEIVAMARLFRHVESLSFVPKSRESESSSETVRIGVTTSDAADVERVVRLNHKQSEIVDKVEVAIENALKCVTSTDKNDIRLAALARVAKRLLD
ncbi:MAG: hypothetical protein JWP89_1638 [Schlesneria sp.]|nr:hypothetical protein [Schlesneria sp.]